MTCVTLLPALWWHCPDCARNNLEIPDVVDVGDEDMIDPYDLIPELENSEIITMATQVKPPEQVMCPNCLKYFSVVF